MLVRGPKCRVAAATAARTVPRELRRRLWSGNLVNLLRKRREEEHKWRLAYTKGKPLSLIIPFFSSLSIFSLPCPLVYRNANVFISSTANQCVLAHQLVCILLTSFAFEMWTRATNDNRIFTSFLRLY